MKHLPRLLVISAAVAGAFGLAGVGWAYWTTTGSGTGAATVGTWESDAIAPTVESIMRDHPNPTNAASVSWTVTFSENVSGVDNSDFVLTGIAGAAIAGAVDPGNGSIYTVTASTGTGSGPLGLNLVDDDTIIDAALNTLGGPGPGNGTFTTGEGYTVDKTAPVVSSVSSPIANGTYGIGTVISVTIAFSEPVTVTGSPQLALNSGGAASAGYASGSGTDTLTLNYTVAPGQTSADLDYAATTSLTGGTITDAAANSAPRTLPAPGAAGSLGANKNVVIDTVAPTVTNVTSSTANGTYGVGAPIAVTVSFSEPVTVTGTPQLALNSGGTASYASGSGTSTLTFGYTVAAGNTSADLDYAATTSLTLNGGTIRDAAANNAIRTLPAPGAAGSLAANKAIVVDGIAPTVTNITSSTPNGTYRTGTIPVTVTFSEPVTVTGTPQLALSTGNPATTTVNHSGSTTNTLTFDYTVAAGNTSADLDYAATTSLTTNGGTIRDADNSAILTLPAPGATGSLGANKNIVIDTTAPTVTTVSSTTTNGSYKAGTIIPVTVALSESVTVTGTPQLTLSTGTPATTAVNYSGTTPNTLTFNYTVAPGNTSADLDYNNAAALALNSGTIKDLAGNNATLTLAAPGAVGSLGASKNLVVDTTPPSAASMTVACSFPNGSNYSCSGTYATALGDLSTSLSVAILQSLRQQCGSGSCHSIHHRWRQLEQCDW